MRTLITAVTLVIGLTLAGCAVSPTPKEGASHSGNPITPGWYADPEVLLAQNRVWVYPTFSAPYNQQMHLDAFSSSDLVNWTVHPHILRSVDVTWARRAVWAPSVVEKDGKCYLFFAANDIQLRGEWAQDKVIGGIGVAVGDSPAGPFKDLLGKPLIDRVHNGAQPIDQQVWQDDDGTWYIVYGGWRRCNIAKLAADFKTLLPFDDGTTFKEITPQGYVEGPIMFRRADSTGKRRLYFMWSEGGWTGPDYSVAYAVADSPLGPLTRVGKVLQQDPAVATGAGHHSVFSLPDADGDSEPDWYIVYHRRPLGETDGNHRVVCIERMYFDADGTIKPVRITIEGVHRRSITQ